MKVKLNAEGELVISAQSDLELYALEHWAKDNEDICGDSETGTDKNIVVLTRIIDE